MNLLINSIKDYLVEKAQNSFKQQNAGESRVLIKGLPRKIGEIVLNSIIIEGGFKIHDRSIPIVLHDNTLDKSLIPASILGGLCGKDHILNLRNTTGIEEIMVILSVGSSIDKSNKTSFDPIGIEENISNVDWVGHELIQKIQEKIFSPTKLKFFDCKDLMQNILLEYEKLAKHENDHLRQWDLLEKLGNNFSNETDNFQLKILLGLINEDQNSNLNFDRHKDIFSRIADSFELNGTSHSFEEWKQKNISNEVTIALSQFHEHLTYVCDSPSEFRRCPFFYYSTEVNDVIENESHWWNILSLDVWKDLIEDTAKVEGSCVVDIINTIYRNSKPCPIVFEEVEFRIKHSTQFNQGDVLTVSRKFKKYDTVEEIIINENQETIIWRHVPISHKTPCTFKFSLDGHKDTTHKVISIKNYFPGVVFDSPQIIKASVLKEVSRKNLKNEYWESAIQLSNSGSHEMRINFDEEKLILKSAKQKKDNSKEFNNLNFQKHVNGTIIVFDLEEESQIELLFDVLKDKIQRTIRLSCTVLDEEPQGVNSVLDKLILQNLSLKGIHEKVDIVNKWSKLHQIQKWYLETPDLSWSPVIIGSDYESCFANPWDHQDSTITNANINVDFRPPNLKIDCPENLKSKRSEILQFLNSQQTVDGNNSGLIEYQELYNEINNNTLKQLIIDYLNFYLEWYTQTPDLCCWFDVIALTNVINGRVLENEPFGLLLSPFHPVKLAWNFLSQEVLYSTLVSKDIKPCPAAGVLDSSRFPDVFLLTCIKAQSTTKEYVFLSMESNLKTWGFYWNIEKINYLNDADSYVSFISSLGFEINGLEGGLSSSQVEQSLGDVFKIKSGQNSLNIKIFSESNDLENFNLGVKNWVTKNLGEEFSVNNRKEERDIWFSSGGKKINIFDTRDLTLQPSDEQLLEISDDSGNNVKWYSNIDLIKDNVDLTIISQLSNESPDLINSDTNSVIFKDGLTRERIRYSIYNTQNKLSFTETRTSKKPDLLGEDLGSNIIRVCYEIEKNVQTFNRGSLNSTPKLHFVHDSLKSSDYCAISSSVVDPAAFFSFEEDSFLWDYDLPSYSNHHSAFSGFYVLAKSSENVKEAVKNSLKLIPRLGNVRNIDVTNVIKEISSRGIPTLKTIASGGTNASGEIGMLIAMNLLQSLEKDVNCFQLFPFSDSDTINLLIPIDPFKNQINTLMSRLDLVKIRPDLLAVSIKKSNAGVSQIKITPIEIKYRKTPMTNRELLSAMDQCQVFIKFMHELNNQSMKSVLWKIARNRLFSDMISFAFSTYGRGIKDLNDSINWAKLHSDVISKLDNLDKLVLAEQGRLIITSNYQLSSFEKVISDNDTLLISFDDAKDILLKTNLGKFEKLSSKIGNWDLTIKRADSPQNQEDGTMIPPPHVTFKTSTEKQQIVSDVDPDTKNNGIEFEVGVKKGDISELAYNFHPSNTNLNQLNIGIVGDLGTGKTQLIKALIYSISKNPDKNRGKSPKFLIMDTKRDYDGSGEKESDQKFVLDIGAKVVKPFHLPINLFDIRNSKDDHPALSKAEFFIDILKKIYGGIGPNQENTILSAVINSFEKLGYTPQCVDYKDFKSPTLKDIFEEYKLLVGDKVDVPFSLMNKLVLARLFEENREKTVDFKDFFDQTVVLSLGGIASNDRNLKMVMIIFMNMYREYMLGVKKLEFIPRDNYQLRNIDSYLLIDEANLIMEYELPVLEDLLLKGREFGVGIILSSQYLSHFRKSNTNYIEPLLTWFVHKVPNVTIKEIQALGINNTNELLVSKIKSLECHYCLYKSLGADGVIIKGNPYYKLIENINSN